MFLVNLIWAISLSSKYKYCISLKAQETVSLLKDILFNLIDSKKPKIEFKPYEVVNCFLNTKISSEVVINLWTKLLKEFFGNICHIL
jgi:hypothetical protein